MQPMLLSARLLLAAAVAASAAAASAETFSPEPARQLVRSIYEQLIGSNTSYSTGQTTPAAEAMAKRFVDAGFAREDVVVAGAAPHKGNVVVRYRGTGAARPLLLLAHLDVVEAKREDWSVDPFTLLEKDGYFYGRGTGDDKAQAAIWVANLIRYKQEGWRPSRDLIVALTADEEGGGPYNGVDWLLKNRRELIDAELCLNEGGWGEIRGGKRLVNLIQVGEKHSATYRLEVRNAGGHSSMPVKENAIYRLADALHRLAASEFDFQLSDVTRHYLETLAGLEAEPTASQLRRAAEGDPAAMRAVAEASPSWNAVMRTTCVATGLDGGHAVNALPQTAGARVNCRILPGQTPEEVQAVLRRVVGRRQGDDLDRGGPRRQPDVATARRRPRRHEAPDVADVAGGRHPALHGDGRHGRPPAAPGRHSDLRRAGHLLRHGRHPLPRPGRAPRRARVLRGPGVPVPAREGARAVARLLSDGVRDLVAEGATPGFRIPPRLHRRADGGRQGLDHADVGGRAVFRADLHGEVQDELARAAGLQGHRDRDGLDALAPDDPAVPIRPDVVRAVHGHGRVLRVAPPRLGAELAGDEPVLGLLRILLHGPRW